MAFPIAAALIASSVANMYSADKQSQASKEAAEKEYESRKQALNELRRQGQITDTEYNNLLSEVQDYYTQRGSLGTLEDVNNYKADIEGYNPEDYVYDFNEFNYDKTKEDFLNPYYSKIIGDTRNQLQHSAAGAGLGRGTGAALNIAKGVAEKEDELYKTAMEEYNQDRDFEYQKYADAITNNQNKLNAIRSGVQYKIGLEGDLANDYYNTQDQAMADALKVKQDQLNAKTAYTTAITRNVLIGVNNGNL